MHKIYYNGELYGAYHSDSACYGEYFKQNTVVLMLFTPDGSQIKNTDVTVNGTTMTTDNAARLYFTESYDETKTYNIICTYAGVSYHKENISVSFDSAENITVDLEKGVLYTKLEYRTPGTYTINIPADVPRAKAQIAGGGGGGSGVARKASDKQSSGGNGGRGGLQTFEIELTKDESFDIIVGAGGKGSPVHYGAGYGSPGGDGSDSIAFGYTAKGGGGATAAYSADRGAKNGSDGKSYGYGGEGGAKGVAYSDAALNGSDGSDGWVIIEYGGDI